MSNTELLSKVESLSSWDLKEEIIREKKLSYKYKGSMLKNMILGEINYLNEFDFVFFFVSEIQQSNVLY